MLRTNYVGHLNKLNLSKYVNNSLKITPTRFYMVDNRKNLINSSLPNLTSIIEFNNIHRRHNDNFRCPCRSYSSNHNEQKLPRFDDNYKFAPSFQLMIKNYLSIFLIRSFFDQSFNKQEFLDGASHAIEVMFILNKTHFLSNFIP